MMRSGTVRAETNVHIKRSLFFFFWKDKEDLQKKKKKEKKLKKKKKTNNFKKQNWSAQRGARTHDPEIKSLMLYRLS